MTVYYTSDPFDPSQLEAYQDMTADSVIRMKYDQLPESIRIYRDSIAAENDITPTCKSEVDFLSQHDCDIYIVHYPADLVTGLLLLGGILLGAAAVLFLAPSFPGQRNIQQSSPNNALSDRQNEVRIAGRIPDIYGTVRSTPDLIAVPYKIFIDHEEFEVAYMCVGRGEYEIFDVRDDSTEISQIEGAKIEVYGPGSSPLNDDTPQLTIGGAITDKVVIVKRLNAINGQEIESTEGRASYSNTFSFASDGSATTSEFASDYVNEYDPIETPVLLQNYFAPGDQIAINGALFAGTYTVDTVLGNTITFIDPELINSEWTTATPADELVLLSKAGSGVGPFVLDLNVMEEVYINVVAPQGLYKDDGKNQYAFDIGIQITLTPIDSNDDPSGPPETFNTIIHGSATTTSQRAATFKINPSFTGRALFTISRTTPKDTTFKGVVADSVKVRDVYMVATPPETNFGNVTTVLAVTQATEGALAAKSRKLNLLVQRKLPAWNGSVYTTPLVGSNRISDIISAVALDPYIGGLTTDEIDSASLYAAADEIETYFGTPEAAEFNGTFDREVTFEETLVSLYRAVFSHGFRQGSFLKILFEKADPDHTMLFNHRNKLPGSEVRTVSFGNVNNYDGVVLTYIDPETDTQAEISLPDGVTLLNPKSVETFGIRSHLQAYFHAWRAWQKIQFQNTALEFRATPEAEIIENHSKILVADNTRTATQDGFVRAQVGLTLTLSQPFVAEGLLDHTIFLQLKDGSVQAIEIASVGANDYEIVLSEAPALSLVTDADSGYSKTTYMIAGNDSVRVTSFLATEKVYGKGNTLTVKGVNYDSRYYSHDSDHIYGII